MIKHLGTIQHHHRPRGHPSGRRRSPEAQLGLGATWCPPNSTPDHPLWPNTAGAKHRRSQVWVRGAVSRPTDQPLSPPSAPLGPMGWLRARGLGAGAPSGHRALPQVAFRPPAAPVAAVLLLLTRRRWFRAPSSKGKPCRYRTLTRAECWGQQAPTASKPQQTGGDGDVVRDARWPHKIP